VKLIVCVELNEAAAVYTIIIAYFIRVCQIFDLLQFAGSGAWENVLPLPTAFV
jgi:hypothetical protein